MEKLTLITPFGDLLGEMLIKKREFGNCLLEKERRKEKIHILV